MQVARAVEYAVRTDQYHLVDLLREFLEECEDHVRHTPLKRDNLLKLCPDRTFYRSIVLERQEHYLHQDRATDGGAEAVNNFQLATVVTLNALCTHMLEPDFANDLLQSPFDAHDTLANPDADLWKDGARIGVKYDPQSNHFWATKFGALKHVASSLETHPDRVVLPKEDARRIRDFLGLGHFGGGEVLALLVFDKNMLRAEFDAGLGSDGQAAFRCSRPFLFEGVGNHRFYIFEPREDSAWNNALELSAIETEKDPYGGPEVILSSIPCKYVRRVHLLTDLNASPCVDAEPEIENIMIRQLLDGENFENVVDKVSALLAEGR